MQNEELRVPQDRDGLRLDMGLPDFDSGRRDDGPDIFWMVSGPANKEFAHCRKDPSSGKKMWWDPPPSQSGVKTSEMLYRTGNLRSGHAVICEGEKASDAVAIAVPDVLVLGTVGGAKVPPTADTLLWALSGGVELVKLWADEDSEGRKHMLTIASLIQKNLPGVKTILWVSTAGIRHKGDAADLPASDRVQRIETAKAMVWSSLPEDGAELTPEVPGDLRAPGVSGLVPFAAKPLSEKGEARKRWLVEPWIRAGKLHSLGGKKGVGKSQILLWLAVQFFKRHAKGTILYFTFEDDELEDIKPRAIVAGVDLSRLIVINAATSFGDVDRIRDAVKQFDARILFFDTLQKYVENANADMNSTFGAQGQIAKIEALARETGVAVVVTRHHRKGRGFSADEADSGSAGISGAMRTVLTAGPYEQGAKGEYGLALAVGNHARHGGGIIYEMEPVKISYAGAMEETVRIKVVREDSTLSADDLVGGGGGERPKTDSEFAEEFLRDEYAGETKAYSENLQAVCKDSDALFSYQTLKRVLKKLGWKVGPKESDQSGKVGGQKSVWLAPETWAQIENELVYMPSQAPPPCTLIQGQQNQQLKHSSEGEKGISVHVNNMYTNSKKSQNGVRQIENDGCPTHGKRGMPNKQCLVENCGYKAEV